MDFLLELKDISHTYQISKQNRIVVLKQINLAIRYGDCVSIYGKSGSGKSTLLNIIGLLMQPSCGQYLLENQDVGSVSDDELAKIRNNKIGFVFQSFFLLPRLDVVHNVALPLFYRGISLRAAKSQVYQILEQVGIAHLHARKPNELSGGEQQRVAIARALVTNPKVLLADEPTGSLDVATGNEIIELFTRIQYEKQCAFMVVTHDFNVTARCKRALVMSDGRIVKDYDNRNHDLKIQDINDFLQKSRVNNL